MRKLLICLALLLLSNSANAQSCTGTGYVSADAYGAIGNGTTNDYASITSAISSLGNGGGTVCLTPPKIYAIGSTSFLGNGTTTAASTINNIKITSCSGGSSGLQGTGVGSAGGATLKWIGASGGTMLQIQGPATGISLTGLLFDGNGLASTLIHNTHGQAGNFEDLALENHTGIAVINDVQCPSFTTVGNGQNHWKNVFVLYGSGTSYSDFDNEGCTTTGHQADTTMNVFENVFGYYAGGTGTYGMKLGFADSNSGYHVQFNAVSPGTGGNDFLFAQQSGSLTQFPYANNFYDVAFTSGVIGGTSGTGGNYFANFNMAGAGGASFPAIAYINGNDILGNYYVNGVSQSYSRKINMALCYAYDTSHVTCQVPLNPPMASTPSVAASTALKIIAPGTGTYTQSSANASLGGLGDSANGVSINLGNFGGALTAGHSYLLDFTSGQTINLTVP